tara:strand:+ start:76 stop:666 length:591 start_codon:yes stop_codon:yes gene_type:complete
MTDVKLNALGGFDLSGGRLNLTSGLEKIAQHVKSELVLQTGLFSLDPSKGTNWRGRILARKGADRIASAEIKRAILSVPGVTRLTLYDQSVSNRVLSVRFAALTTQGEINAQGIAPDLTGANQVLRRDGIEGLIALLRARGLDALASLVESRGFDVLPTLRGADLPGADSLAREYEIADWTPWLVMLYDGTGALLA